MKVVKSDFDFGWKEWKNPPPYAELAFQYQKGDILDVGCGTCQLYTFSRKKGWKGKYYGIDVKKYDYDYPKGIELIIGDALEVEFPEVDTIILYNILEHIDDPVKLLKKALNSARENVLVNVPKRNEELWKLGIVEYHQLDKTHKHCGFSRDEVYKLVELAGGNITKYIEHSEISARILLGLWNNIIPKGIVYVIYKIFPSKKFYQEIWCEVVENGD